jgi:hypothetical protein
MSQRRDEEKYLVELTNKHGNSKDFENKQLGQQIAVARKRLTELNTIEENNTLDPSG